MAHKATNVTLLMDHSVSMRSPADRSDPASPQKAQQAAQAMNAILHRLQEYATAHRDDTVNVAQITFGTSYDNGGANLADSHLGMPGTNGVAVRSFASVHRIADYLPRATGGNTPLYTAVAQALVLCNETDNLAGNTAHLLVVITDGYAGDEYLRDVVVGDLKHRMAVGGWTVCYIFVGKDEMKGGYESKTILPTAESQATVLGLDPSLVYAGSDLLGQPGLLKGLNDFLAARERDEQAIDHWFTDTHVTENADDALESLRKEEAR